MEQPYLYVNSRLLRRQRSKRRKKILLVASILIPITIVTILFFPKSKETKAVAQIAPTPIPTSTLNVAVASTSKSLEAEVKRALEDSSGTYGVAIKNLETNESYYLNSHEKFETASLYKLWTMGEAYFQIEEGKIKKDQVLAQNVATLNKKFKISSESAELSEGNVKRTVYDAISRMITYSENYSALLLTERLKLSSLTSFLTRNDFSESSIGTGGSNPSTTPHDIAILLEKIYKGELANRENSSEMIDLLKKQQINGKIPKYLPEGIEIAHKTGELDAFSHDAAIVYTDKGDYILVVMSEANSKAGADDRIANISKNVYEYFLTRE